eukprot:m.235138 g.235138  ORF g.235138 m.235138 type:complete len:1083 (+) comp17399_c0_seq1:86-3334(+)
MALSPFLLLATVSLSLSLPIPSSESSALQLQWTQRIQRQEERGVHVIDLAPGNTTKRVNSAPLLHVVKTHLQRPITDHLDDIKARGRLESTYQDLLQQHGTPLPSQPPSAITRHRRGDNGCPYPANTADKIGLDDFVFQGFLGTLRVRYLGHPKTMTIAWASQRANGTSPDIYNIFCSNDYGTSFSTCQGVTEDIAWVYNGPSQDGNVWVVLRPQAETGTGYFYLSKDETQFSKVTTSKGPYQRYLQHPSRTDLLLGFKDTSTDFAFKEDVYLLQGVGSEGITESLLARDLDFAEWADNKENPDEATVLMTQYQNIPKSFEEKAVIHLVRVESPYDADNTFVSKENAYAFQQEGKFLFVKENPMNGESTLHVSTDQGTTFNPAVFPSPGKSTDYAIVASPENDQEAFVVVQHSVTAFVGDVSIDVTQPTTQAQTINAVKLSFTPVVPGNLSSDLAYPQLNPTGCSASGGISGFVSGAVAILERGDCPFAEKIINAQLEGAVAVIIIDSRNDTFSSTFAAPDDLVRPLIPAVMVRNVDGSLFRSIAKDTNQVTLREDNVQEQALFDTQALYISDKTGLDYSVSLKDILYYPSNGDLDSDEAVDLHHVLSEPGTLIANRVEDGYIASVISYNKGASWNRLPLPDKAQDTCRISPGGNTDKCSLHVTLSSSYSAYSTPMPVSIPTSPGIILANGFTGTAVGGTYSSDSYLSTDGGFSWIEIKNEPHDFRILNHGSVLVAVPLSESNTISYSLSEGEDGFADYNVLPEDSDGDYFYVGTEPYGPALKLGVYTFDAATQQWISHAVNFGPTLTKLCNDDADYKVFSAPPSTNAAVTTCLMGSIQKLRRRWPCNLCRQRDNFDARSGAVYQIPCDCSADDYQCAPGFFKVDPLDVTGPCIVDYAYAVETECPPDISEVKVSPYTLVPGDECSFTSSAEKFTDRSETLKCSKVAPSPPSRNGGGASGSKGKGTGIFFAVLAALVVVFAVVMYLSPTARSSVIRLVGTEEGCFACCGRFLANFSCFRRQTTYNYSSLADLDDDDDLGPLSSDDDDLIGMEDALEADGRDVAPAMMQSRWQDDSDEDELFA